MSVEIERYIDVEEEIRAALADYMTCYVRPLPDGFTVPSVLITAVGGAESNKIDTFYVTIDSRADDEYTAQLNLRNAIGILEKIAESQETAIRHVTINSLMSWGSDPVRKDLSMCTVRLNVYAHKEIAEVNTNE